VFRQYISGKFAARAGGVQKITPLGADPYCIAFKFKNIKNTRVVQYAGAIRLPDDNPLLHHIHDLGGQHQITGIVAANVLPRHRRASLDLFMFRHTGPLSINGKPAPQPNMIRLKARFRQAFLHQQPEGPMRIHPLSSSALLQMWSRDQGLRYEMETFRTGE
jgi:hypothetical protein